MHISPIILAILHVYHDHSVLLYMITLVMVATCMHASSYSYSLHAWSDLEVYMQRHFGVTYKFEMCMHVIGSVDYYLKYVSFYRHSY